MMSYLEALTQHVIVFLCLLPLTWLLSKIMQAKWNFREYYFFMMLFFLIRAVVIRFI